MKKPSPDHPIVLANNPHRVRVVLGGFIVAETTRALTLREAAHPPVQFIPREDVNMSLLDRTDHRTHCPYKGEASHFTVTAGGLKRENAAWSYEKPYPAVSRIAGYMTFHPDKVDAIEEFKD